MRESYKWNKKTKGWRNIKKAPKKMNGRKMRKKKLTRETKGWKKGRREGRKYIFKKKKNFNPMEKKNQETAHYCQRREPPSIMTPVVFVFFSVRVGVSVFCIRWTKIDHLHREFNFFVYVNTFQPCVLLLMIHKRNQESIHAMHRPINPLIHPSVPIYLFMRQRPPIENILNESPIKKDLLHQIQSHHPQQ